MRTHGSPGVRVSIYNKGPPLPAAFLAAAAGTSFSITALPNLGREFHTFLTHCDALGVVRGCGVVSGVRGCGHHRVFARIYVGCASGIPMLHELPVIRPKPPRCRPVQAVCWVYTVSVRPERSVSLERGVAACWPQAIRSLV